MEEIEAKEKAIELANEGKEFHEIKSRLQEMGFDAPDIQYALKGIDEQIVAYQLGEQTKSKYRMQMLLGGFVFFLAIALAIMMILTVNRFSFWFFLLAFGGYWIFREGFRKYKRPPNDLTSEKQIFFKSKFRR